MKMDFGMLPVKGRKEKEEGEKFTREQTHPKKALLPKQVIAVLFGKNSLPRQIPDSEVWTLKTG